VSSRGFSVLEALVTLVILAMVTTVMMQGLFFALGVRERVIRSDAEARRVALEQAWFRDSVGAAIADLPGAGGAFRGDAAAFHFTTLDPIDGSQRLARIEWRVEDARLSYRQGDQPPVVIAGLSREAAFRYLDAAGGWHAVWPPSSAQAAAGSPPIPAAARAPRAEHLPRAVALAWHADGRADLWLAGIGADAALPIPLLVREGGLDGSGP